MVPEIISLIREKHRQENVSGVFSSLNSLSLPIYIHSERWHAAARPYRKNGDPPRLGREGKLELTEVLRSKDRS